MLEEEPVKVNYNKPGVNEEFKDTVEELWRYAQLNLLDVTVDDNGVYTPSFIVLEPDYLLISVHWQSAIRIMAVIPPIIF